MVVSELQLGGDNIEFVTTKQAFKWSLIFYLTFLLCWQSDCESDEELFIFHREHPNLIPDLSEELQEFSLEDADTQVVGCCEQVVLL